MNKKYLLAFWLISSITIGGKVFAQDTDVNTVIAVANKSIKSYLEKIPAGNEKGYGFNNRQEFEIVKTGNPYHVFTLSNDFFKDDKLPTEKNYLVAVNEWRVPITVNGQYRALLTIAKVKGIWKAVNFGAAALAMEMGEVEGDSTGHPAQPILLILYRQNCYFVILNSSNDISSWKAIPLSSAKNVFHLENKSYSLSETLSLIKKPELKK